MIAALLLLGLALLMLAAHPFTTYPASLWMLARWFPRPIADGRPAGRAALCVCAYNEEKVIRRKVENMLAMQDSVEGLELLVYVDGSNDRTAEIVRTFNERVRLVESPIRQGKTHGMNTLVGLTSADYIIFSDANVEFAPDAVGRLVSAFADPMVGCVCGHLVYITEAGNATAASGSVYWRLEERIKRYESATGSVMGADGSIFALRRSLHVEPMPDLIDDMFVSLTVLCDGYRIVRAADAYAYEQAVSRPTEEFRRKMRIACQAFNVHRALRGRLRTLGWLDRYKYVSHKLLRWLTVFLLIGAAICLAAGLGLLVGLRGLVAVATLATILALAMRHARGGVLATLRDVIVAFIATGIGVLRSLRGERFQTWNPPASARGLSPHPVE